MDFLESILLPQSSQRIEILSYLITISYMILLPYLALLFGSTFLSCRFNARGKSSNNAHYIKLSKDLISLSAFNIYASMGIILLPLLILMYSYAQIVQQDVSVVFENLNYTIILLIPAVVLVYIFKRSFGLSDIAKLVNKTKDDSTNRDEEFSVYKSPIIKALTNSSRIAVWLLFASSYILIACIKTVSDSSSMNEITSLSDMLFRDQTIISFLYFLSLSFALTSASALYIYFKPNSYYEVSERKYADIVKKFFLNTAMIFVLVLPLIYAIDVMSIPSIALSSSIFGISIGVLLILLLISSLLYHMIKYKNLNYRGLVLLLFIGLFYLIAAKEQAAFNTSSQLKVKKVVKAFEAKTIEMKEQLGLK
ncbi:MAG: hypothetical protein ABFS12_17995 [Bacteroidota bacterium]